MKICGRDWISWNSRRNKGKNLNCKSFNVADPAGKRKTCTIVCWWWHTTVLVEDCKHENDEWSFLRREKCTEVYLSTF